MSFELILEDNLKQTENMTRRQNILDVPLLGCCLFHTPLPYYLTY